MPFGLNGDLLVKPEEKLEKPKLMKTEFGCSEVVFLMRYFSWGSIKNSVFFKEEFLEVLPLCEIILGLVAVVKTSQPTRTKLHTFVSRKLWLHLCQTACTSSLLIQLLYVSSGPPATNLLATNFLMAYTEI